MKNIFLFLMLTYISFGNEFRFNRSESEVLDKNDVFNNLTKELSVLKGKLNLKKGDGFNLKNEDSLRAFKLSSHALSNAEQLKNLNSCLNVPVSQNYLLDLSENTDIVEELNYKKRLSIEDIDKLKIIDTDLQIKVETIENNKCNGFDNITVVVRTIDFDNHEVKNYIVWYVKDRDLNNKDKFLPFNNYSSPCKLSLSPGKYWFWSQSRKDRRESKKEVRVINDSSKSFETEISIP